MYPGWICKAPDDCAFPFTYKGRKYTECRALDQDIPWCSTTTDYVLRSGKWVNCDCKSIRAKFKLVIICTWSLSGFTFGSTLITASVLLPLIMFLGLETGAIVNVSPYKLASESLSWFLICIIFTNILLCFSLPVNYTQFILGLLSVFQK